MDQPQGATLGKVPKTSALSPQSFWLASACRIKLCFLLTFFDILGASLAAGLFSGQFKFDREFLIFAGIFLLAALSFDLYASTFSRDLSQSAKGAFASGLIFVPISTVMAWLVTDWGIASRLAVATAAGILIALLARIAVAIAVWVLAGDLTERVLIVGRSEPSRQIVESGCMSGQRVKFVGQVVIGDNEATIPLTRRVSDGIELAPDLTAFVDLTWLGIDRVVITTADMESRILDQVLGLLEALPHPVYVIAEPPTVKPSSPGQFCLVLRPAPLRPLAMLVKRSLDVAVSFSALLFLFPLLLIIASLIRLETSGSVLFHQARIGLGNRPFTVYKFRTMRVGVQGTDGSIQATRNDARVTRVGSFLRRTSLDELPQLLNVLNGTMSLVGPRPHPTELNRRFAPIIKSYSSRHRVTPGITGWAQVNGFRGETRTVEQMQRRIDHDLEYIERHSIGFDLWIMLRTVLALVVPRNAY